MRKLLVALLSALALTAAVAQEPAVGVLYSGTSSMGAEKIANGTAGQCLVANASGKPTFQTCSSTFTCGLNEIAFENASGVIGCSSNILWQDSIGQQSVANIGNSNGRCTGGATGANAPYTCATAVPQLTSLPLYTGTTQGQDLILAAGAALSADLSSTLASNGFYTSLVLGNNGDSLLHFGKANPQFTIWGQNPGTGNAAAGTVVKIGVDDTFGTNANGPWMALSVSNSAATQCPGTTVNGNRQFSPSPGARCSALISSSLPLVLGVNPGSSPDVAYDIMAATGLSRTMSIGTTPVTAIGMTSAGTNAVLSIGDTGGTSSLTLKGPAGGILLSGVSTGTNADFLCMAVSGAILIQSSACTISSERFKTNLQLLEDASPVMRLHVRSFEMKQTDIPNRDPNFTHRQVGLVAEEVAEVMPDCAVYENDMRTPKSYRPECVTAYGVRVLQDHQRVLERQQIEIYTAYVWLALLTGYALIRRRRAS